MAYTPNASDPTQPTIDVDASTAAAEFRALKLAFQTVAASSGKNAGVRQTVLTGPVNAAGNADFLSTVSGLRPSISVPAGQPAIVISAAKGFDSIVGAVDLYESFSNTVNDILGADLPVSNLSYLYRTIAGAWGQTLRPPQYDFAYKRTSNCLLHFEGADASTSIIDAYGNTWVASGNAQIDTAQFKIGTSSCLFDGTGDYVECTEFKNAHPIDNENWTIEFWTRFNAFPATTNAVWVSLTTAGSLGIFFALNDAAGVRKSTTYLSSDAASQNIASGSLGTSTTWSLNTWYHIALTYDSLQGKFYVYKDGVLDNTITSAEKVHGAGTITGLRLGCAADGVVSPLNGWMDEFQYSPYCKYPNGNTFTPATTAAAVGGYFFARNDMKMYEITSPSVTAGVNPGMTQRDVVFVGEADTNGTVVTATRTYAYKGTFSQKTNPAIASTRYAIQHNIGIPPTKYSYWLETLISSAGFRNGDRHYRLDNYQATETGMGFTNETRNIASHIAPATSISVHPNRTTGVLSTQAHGYDIPALELSRGW
jgi:hypothetical protein